MQELKNIGQRKAVLLGERDVESVVGSGRLQFEIEAAAKALAQGESPGLVDAAAKWRVDDELHPSAFVEEAFRDDCLLRGYVSQYGSAFERVLNELFGTR